MGRRFRRNCGLYFFCFRDTVPKSKDGWGSIYSALHLRKVHQRTRMDQQSNWQVLCQNKSRNGDYKWNMSNVLRGMWKRQQRSKWNHLARGQRSKKQISENIKHASIIKYWINKQVSEERAKKGFRMGRRQHWARWTLLTSATLGLVSLPALCIRKFLEIYCLIFFVGVKNLFFSKVSVAKFVTSPTLN